MIGTLAAMVLAASPLQAAASLLSLPGTGEVGSWVEYRVGIGGSRPVFVRLAMLGEEAVGTEEGQWLELWFSARPGSATQVYRALVVGALDRPGAVRRVLARLGGGSVFELPASSFAAVMRPGRSSRGSTGAATRKVVHTEAGTFRVQSRTFRSGNATVHLETAPEVPLGGVVRLEIAGLTAELSGTGQGAESGIPADAEVRPLPPEKQVPR